MPFFKVTIPIIEGYSEFTVIAEDEEDAVEKVKKGKFKSFKDIVEDLDFDEAEVEYI